MAVDRDPDALALGQRLAESRQVQFQFRVGDLRDKAQVPVGPWAAILAFRFLHIPLLEEIVNYLLPKGLAMVRTYRDVPGWQGPPAQRHRLAAGQLLKLFPAPRFRVLIYQEDWDQSGKPLAGIVAQAKGADAAAGTGPNPQNANHRHTD
jgi:hypothetical protein